MLSRAISTFARGLIAAAVFSAAYSFAQPPDDQEGPPDRGRGSRQSAPSADGIVARLMAFDKNQDGKLTRDEVTDPRLLRLFDRIDTVHDGVVTKEQITEYAKKMVAESGQGRGNQGPGGFGGPGGGEGGDGPGGFGPPGGGFGPGGGGPGGGGPGGGAPGGGAPGGFGPPGGGFGQGGGSPPQPGQILPPRVQSQLNLTAAQKKKLAALQKQVDERLAKILTDEQKKQLELMQSRGGGQPQRGRGPQGDRPDRNGPDGNGPPGPPRGDDSF